jgi:hypothetical protein
MPSLQSASKKALYENKLSQLDNLGSNLTDFLEEQTFTVIEDILGDFVLRIQQNIENESGMITTGKISDISVKVEGNEVNVYAYPYLVYQDLGVNGAINKKYNTPFAYTNKIPPVDVIKKWIKDKSISLTKDEGSELSEEQKINNAAWAISKKIYKDGIKPRNIYSKEIPQLLADLDREITNFASDATVIVVDVNKTK